MKEIYCLIKAIFSATFLVTMISLGGAAQNPKVSIVTDQAPGLAAMHGILALTDALQARKVSFQKITSLEEARGEWLIVAGLASGKGAAAALLKKAGYAVPDAPEALSIRKATWTNKLAWVISGADDRGLMYGLLDVADRIGWSDRGKDLMSEVDETTEQPSIVQRGISIYTMNRAYWESRFYDEGYWAKYLDMLAKNRFNSLVVIFGYENGGFLAPPYPYFFDVDKFADVRMVGITKEEQQRNLNALNHLIDMAHARGIDFTVGIWDHIYRGGVQGGGIPGTRTAPDQPVPGLVWGLNADNLTAYTKEALAKFVHLVPDLDAIQFRMHNESGLKKGEQVSFWSDVFKMMKKTAPRLRLDLRAKELPQQVIQSALDVGLPFRITTKYWMEQMGMPYHPTKTNPDQSAIRHSYAYLLHYPKQYKIHWRLWNGGTSRVLLWGDPEYVRRFAESTHLYDGEGYEVNEPLATKMEAQPHNAKPFDLLSPENRYYEFEFERYWHFFQVFGRVGYNPNVSPEIWNREFERRFGKKAGPLVAQAVHQASWILPRIITSSYPYRLFPMTRGWAEKQRLGDLPVFARAKLSDMQQFANFDEEAQLRIEGGETARMLPSVNSLWFKETSAELDKLITLAEKSMRGKENKEFRSTIVDLKILSNLSLYHSRRIPAAVSYRIFERTKSATALDDAIAYERKAIEAWRQIVAAADGMYTDNLMMGVCVADLCGSWKDELVALEKGLQKLEEKRHSLVPETDAIKPVSIAADSYLESLSDIDFDKLFQVTHEKVTRLPVGQPLVINARITAPAGVKWVRLRYRSVNQEFEYETLAMEKTDVKDSYQAVVPASQINPEWDFMYFIEMMDNDGHGKIYPDLNKETPYTFVALVR